MTMDVSSYKTFNLWTDERKYEMYFYVLCNGCVFLLLIFLFFFLLLVKATDFRSVS